jgi:outer membrane protein
VDTEYVLKNMPEYTTVQQKLDKLEQQWRQEIQKKQKEVRALEQEFEARELLYTDEERTRKQEAIEKARKEVEQLRQQYFGPNGQLYSRQQELMRPIQERVLEATESVATDGGYDYIVDKKGETLFLYAREEHDLSDQVLRELGINIEANEPQSNQQ